MPNKTDTPTELRILYVDDDPQICVVFQKMVQQRCPDCTVDLAECGAQALRMCELYRYDVVIADIIMPYMNGVDLAAEIIDRFCTPVILTTGYRKEDVLPPEELGEGMICCLTKPFSLTDVEVAIRRALKENSKRVQECKDRSVRESLLNAAAADKRRREGGQHG
jgi:DNA-binding NtrC family response regulator